MECYTHLINDERMRIRIMKQEAFGVRHIARKPDLSPSTTAVHCV